MYLKIIEKPVFFLGFFKFLEAYGHASGSPFGTPWGGLGDALGGLGDALGGLGGARGTPWRALLGRPKGRHGRNLLGRPN